MGYIHASAVRYTVPRPSRDPRVPSMWVDRVHIGKGKCHRGQDCAPEALRGFLPLVPKNRGLNMIAVRRIGLRHLNYAIRRKCVIPTTKDVFRSYCFAGRDCLEIVEQ